MVGGAVLTVWAVFRDPTFDYRPLILGVLLPDLVDAPFGGARVMHSITGSVGLLAIVMALTVGRRAQRKRWLGLPIGTFLHLILDGAFADTKVFWWPFTGGGFGDARLPIVERGIVNVALELAGLAICAFLWHRFRLADPRRRRRFVREGKLVAPTSR
jgi:membrane-bound metal-dependent hydrolase YbcI (DUF457 family)